MSLYRIECPKCGTDLIVREQRKTETACTNVGCIGFLPAHGDIVWEIAIALSGGGHRASLFSLGVLLALVDLRLNRQVSYVASVSGGSITNASAFNVSSTRKLQKASKSWPSSSLM